MELAQDNFRNNSCFTEEFILTNENKKTSEIKIIQVENLEDKFEPGKNKTNSKFKRQITRHVQTRWYRAPEVILVQK